MTQSRKQSILLVGEKGQQKSEHTGMFSLAFFKDLSFESHFSVQII